MKPLTPIPSPPAPTRPGEGRVEFERLSPAAHQDFLESLGLEDDEIARMREESRDRGSLTSSDRRAG
jgi:hypothetical protein